MAADVGRASACAGLQSRWRDSYERCGRRAKAPQAEACPTWTGDPTLARKCEVIPAPALRGIRLPLTSIRVVTGPKRNSRSVAAYRGFNSAMNFTNSALARTRARLGSRANNG